MKAKRILFLVNHEIVIYNFRKELVESLINEGYDVYISSPIGPKTKKLANLGAKILPIHIDRHSKNVLKDLMLLIRYVKLMKQLKPSVVLSYTIKPNIYGGMAARFNKVIFIPTITGLGNALNQGIKSVIPNNLYKLALKKASHVFFQNQPNLDYMRHHRILSGEFSLVNGSGVNIKEYSYEKYPLTSELQFVYVGRIMKAKGIELYLDLASKIKSSKPHWVFHIVGQMEEDYQEIIEELSEKKIVVYHGYLEDAKPIYKKAHAIIHPTHYHEGISNVLLEAAATGRPVIASNVIGSKDTFIEGDTGFGFDADSFDDLLRAFNQFLKLSIQEKEEMGRKGRNYVATHFNRSEVVDKYKEMIKIIEPTNPKI